MANNNEKQNLLIHPQAFVMQLVSGVGFAIKTAIELNLFSELKKMEWHRLKVYQVH